MDTLMTNDPFGKETCTDITRGLINFTLEKSSGLYNLHSATGKKNNPTISVIYFNQKRPRTPK